MYVDNEPAVCTNNYYLIASKVSIRKINEVTDSYVMPAETGGPVVTTILTMSMAKWLRIIFIQASRGFPS